MRKIEYTTEEVDRSVKLVHVCYTDSDQWHILTQKYDSIARSKSPDITGEDARDWLLEHGFEDEAAIVTV